MCTTTSPSFIKKSDQKQKSFINSTFFKFLIHLFHNSLIFANSLLDDPAPNLLSGGLKINFSGIENSYFSYFCRLVWLFTLPLFHWALDLFHGLWMLSYFLLKLRLKLLLSLLRELYILRKFKIWIIEKKISFRLYYISVSLFSRV